MGGLRFNFLRCPPSSGIEVEEEDESEVEEEGGAGGHLASLSEQLKVGIIPNADLIHRARREREERRQMGGGATPSVMSLSVTNKKIQIAKGKSRLIREDDNDRSDDSGGEEGGRRRMDAGHHDTAAVKQFQVQDKESRVSSCCGGGGMLSPGVTGS